MTNSELRCTAINEGNASRYIKPKWVSNGILSTIAFDLRTGTPPESYVSHFMAAGVGSECFRSAYKIISAHIKKCHLGSIALLNVTEALEEVNDEATPFIKFVEQGLPHCGLVYVTNNLAQIQEVKATLSLLAQQNMMLTVEIAHDSPETKQIS